MLESRDQIDLPLENDRRTRLDQRALAFIETEEDAPFGENRRLRRVHILGFPLVVVENPATEGHHFPIVISDGEHQPIAKAVIPPLVITLLGREETACKKFLPGKALGQGPVPKGLPSPWRKSEQPPHGDLLGEFPFLQVSAGMLGITTTQKVHMKPFGSLLVELY
jgi:hypothetical protein